jgi:integrase
MSGHVRRRGQRSWELKFDIGTDPLTGKRITKYHSFKGTKREAEAELVRLKAGADRGDYVDPSKTTLAEFLDRWERDWAAVNVGPKTLERYRELLKCHVRPHVGAVAIQKLQPVHLAELYAKLLREGRGDGRGLAARTVGHVHRAIHKALVVATEWGVVQRNVADVAKPPKVQAGEIEILGENATRALLQQLRGRALYPLAVIGLATGMRRGELLALRWRDVDLDGGKLRVEQSLEQTKVGGLRFKAPKTKHGRRTITLPASAVAELRQQLEKRKRVVAGVPDGAAVDLSLVKLPDDALVFANWDGSTRSPNATTKEWVRTLAQLKLPAVSLHALRHTHASQLIAASMDVLTISRRLGHGSPTITLGVYGHLFSNTDDRAAQVVEAAFRRTITD